MTPAQPPRQRRKKSETSATRPDTKKTISEIDQVLQKLDKPTTSEVPFSGPAKPEDSKPLAINALPVKKIQAEESKPAVFQKKLNIELVNPGQKNARLDGPSRTSQTDRQAQLLDRTKSPLTGHSEHSNTLMISQLMDKYASDAPEDFFNKDQKSNSKLKNLSTGPSRKPEPLAPLESTQQLTGEQLSNQLFFAEYQQFNTIILESRVDHHTSKIKLENGFKFTSPAKKASGDSIKFEESPKYKESPTRKISIEAEHNRASYLSQNSSFLPYEKIESDDSAQAKTPSPKNPNQKFTNSLTRYQVNKSQTLVPVEEIKATDTRYSATGQPRPA